MCDRSFLTRCGLAGGIGLSCLILTAASTGPITRLTVDAQAPIVPLFDGAENGSFQVRISTLDAHRANVFITNQRPQTLNVALPKAAIGVHVLPQFNGFFNNPQNNGNAANGNNPFAPNGQGTGVLDAVGMAQNVGGTFTSAVGNPGSIPGFPSLPPEWADNAELAAHAGIVAVPANRTIQLRLRTVCLNYGRPEPTPKMTYELASVERVSSHPDLAELLESYSPRVDEQVMQAAAWHVANSLSWEQLAQLPDRRLPATGAKYFNLRQVQQARTLVTAARERAAQRLTPESIGPLSSR